MPGVNCTWWECLKRKLTNFRMYGSGWLIYRNVDICKCRGTWGKVRVFFMKFPIMSVCSIRKLISALSSVRAYRKHLNTINDRIIGTWKPMTYSHSSSAIETYKLLWLWEEWWHSTYETVITSCGGIATSHIQKFTLLEVCKRSFE